MDQNFVSVLKYGKGVARALKVCQVTRWVSKQVNIYKKLWSRVWGMLWPPLMRPLVATADIEMAVMMVTTLAHTTTPRASTAPDTIQKCHLNIKNCLTVINGHKCTAILLITNDNHWFMYNSGLYYCVTLYSTLSLARVPTTIIFFHWIKAIVALFINVSQPDDFNKQFVRHELHEKM